MIAALARAGTVVALTVLATGCFLTADGDDLASGFERENYVDGLQSPVAMAVDPKGRVFVTEKNSGDVRLIDERGRLQAEPVIHFDVASSGEWGLLGIALHPGFEANNLAYVYYMEPAEEGRSQPIIARFQVDGAVGRNPSLVVSDLPRTSITGASPEVDLFSNIHVGGNLHFGPDDLLYVAVGDFGVYQQRSADPGEAIGKMLRFTAEGQPAPALNLPPEGDVRVFAYGLRNPFDFDFDDSGQIFAVDNGPDACDEINIVAEGLDYGWPSPRISQETCDRRDGEQAIGYLSRDDTDPNENGSTVGPSSLLYLADGFGRLSGPALVVCEVNSGRLRYLPLDGDTVNLDDSETLAEDCFTDVIQLGDGSLLYTTMSSLRRVTVSD